MTALGEEREALARALARVPMHLRNGLAAYVISGVRPGSFLQAAIANDFVDAVCRAVDLTAEDFVAVAKFLYNEIPGPAWGSRERMEAWIKSGGLAGQEEASDARN